MKNPKKFPNGRCGIPRAGLECFFSWKKKEGGKKKNPQNTKKKPQKTPNRDFLPRKRGALMAEQGVGIPSGISKGLEKFERDLIPWEEEGETFPAHSCPHSRDQILPSHSRFSRCSHEAFPAPGDDLSHKFLTFFPPFFPPLFKDIY